MTDSNQFMKLFYRSLFAILMVGMAYVLFQQEYNFAHWVPHTSLRELGVPYSALLMFESHADKILHPLGALLLTGLLIKSELPMFADRKPAIFMLAIVAMLAAEIIQWQIGRGFEVLDLILGVIGSYLAFRWA